MRVLVGLGVRAGVSRDLRHEPVPLPDGEEVRLTFSAGACRWKPGDDFRGLLSKADEALYLAKDGGNKVVHLDQGDLQKG